MLSNDCFPKSTAGHRGGCMSMTPGQIRNIVGPTHSFAPHILPTP